MPRGSEGTVLPFLTSTLHGSGQRQAPAILPRGKNPGAHWIGGRVGFRACLDAVKKRKIAYLCQE
jgi:hypothetical protein